MSTGKGVGPVARVWAICDEYAEAPRSFVIGICRSSGINKHTAQTQYQRWYQKRHGRETIPLPKFEGELTHEAGARREWDRLRKDFPELERFTFDIDRQSTSRAGVCSWKRRKVMIAAWHLDRSELSEVIDTVRHEAAHAIAGPGAKHGSWWKTCCLRVGARPVRCYGENIAAQAPARERRQQRAPLPRPWIAECPVHGEVYRYTRRPKWDIAGQHARCRKCRSVVTIRYEGV